MVGLKYLHIDLIFSLFDFFKAEVCLEGVFVNLFYLNIREVLLKYSLVFYAIFPQISQIHCSTNIVLDMTYLLLSGSHIFCNFGREYYEFNLRL